MLSLKGRIGYGLGYMGTAIMTQTVVTWALYFYAPPPDRGLIPLVAIGLVGIAMGLGRIIDAIADPIIGVWSDNTQSRWGRRMPFIVWGTPFLILSFIALWRPPLQTVSTWNFYYLALILAFFFFFFTVVVCPYLALLPEIAKDPKDRVNLATWQALFNIIGVGLAMVGSAWLIESYGFWTMGLVLGAIALVSFYAPVFTLKEPRLAKEKTQPLGFRESVMMTLSNRPFLIFVLGQLLFWLGFNMVMQSTTYVVTVLMGQSEGAVGLALGGALGVAILSFPLINWWANRYGRKKALIWTMWLFVLVLGLLGTVGLWPLGGDALQGYLILALAGIPLAGLFILPNALVAEITDLDEQTTGRSRAAIYFGIQGLILKAGLGVSALLTSAILGQFGYDVGNALGVRLIGPVAAILVLLGVIIFRQFPDDLIHVVEERLG